MKRLSFDEACEEIIVQCCGYSPEASLAVATTAALAVGLGAGMVAALGTAPRDGFETEIF